MGSTNSGTPKPAIWLREKKNLKRRGTEEYTKESSSGRGLERVHNQIEKTIRPPGRGKREIRIGISVFGIGE